MTRLLRPTYWGGHLLMVVGVALAVGLGLWQLHAWQERRADESRNLAHTAPRALSSVMGGDDPFPGDDLGRPVSFSGRWLDKGTVYVSDRRQAGRTGYWVVSPLLVDGTRSAMPVVRGWAPRPAAPAPSGTADITGWLQFGEGSGAEDAHPDDDILPELRIASLVQRTDADLYSAYVIADEVTPPTATAGLAAVNPDAAPTPSQLTALRNLLYAIQWWVFGVFALVVWVRWCRDSLGRLDAEPVPSSA